MILYCLGFVLLKTTQQLLNPCQKLLKVHNQIVLAAFCSHGTTHCMVLPGIFGAEQKKRIGGQGLFEVVDNASRFCQLFSSVLKL